MMSYQDVQTLYMSLFSYVTSWYYTPDCLLVYLSGSDVKTLGHDNKLELVEELLALMAREKHSPEVSRAWFLVELEP